MDIRNFYQQHIDTLRNEIKVRKNKNKAFIIGEIVSFAAVFGCLFLYTTELNRWITTGLLFASAILYLIIRHNDNQNNTAISRLEHLESAYNHEINYLNGDFSCFDNGLRFSDSHHSFAYDLDVFGNSSLFNRYCRTVTTGGAKYLADAFMLKAEPTIKNINDQAAAIEELSKMPEWRMQFIAYGQEGEVDTDKIRKAINEVKKLQIPVFAHNRIATFVAYTSLIGFLGSVLLSILQLVSANIPIWWGIIQFFIVYSLCNKTANKISQSVSSLHDQLRVYIALIRLIATSKSTALINQQAAEELSEALPSFGQMENLLESLDRRGNILGMFFTNMFALSDFFVIRKFCHWQDTYVERIDEWLNTVSQIDALVSMATMQFNHPEAKTALFVEGERVSFKAKSLVHPFLGKKAVANDFSINDRNFYIITGANMAGKSTFLRTLGVNYILAMNGMPVFAEQLEMTKFRLFTSMRTSDDLTHGISYFNAELLRLQQLLETIADSQPTLIILDEILKGTNSVDKLNGSRMFLEHVKNLNVTGIIATHDLELSKMADTYAGQFHNYCFEIELGNNVTYSYKIEKGIAKNQNATFLLKQLLNS